jgi:glycosyltransferase involved in cell wall biosynthesis
MERSSQPDRGVSKQQSHISVCVCTYKRPDLLRRSLEALCAQETGGLFTYSIVVVDNDRAESGHAVVSAIQTGSVVPLKYCVESRQNIALARNKAVEYATGDFVAFLDDDEIPINRWLWNLFQACTKYNVDGVLGPVKPHFDQKAPRWVVNGDFYNRPTYPTGFVIDWRKGRTGNTLLRKLVFTAGEQPFRPEFRVGEDQDFFRRMIEKGHAFIWCDEAVAYEVVPPSRWKRTFMLKRALLRGASSLLHPTFGVLDVTKSIIAVPAYLAVLPLCLFLGQRRFMTYSVKLFDHLGKLLALLGIRPVKGAYVTD